MIKILKRTFFTLQMSTQNDSLCWKNYRSKMKTYFFIVKLRWFHDGQELGIECVARVTVLR